MPTVLGELRVTRDCLFQPCDELILWHSGCFSLDVGQLSESNLKSVLMLCLATAWNLDKNSSGNALNYP